MKKYIPNILTLLRGIGTLLIIFLFLKNANENALLIFILFILTSITDFLDGYLARKWQVVSDFGKIMDPLFDKLLVYALLFLMFPLNIIPKIFILILFARDIITDIMRYYLLSKKQVIAAINSAKYKTTFQLITISFMLFFLIWPEYPIIKRTAFISGSVALFFSIYSGTLYTKNFFSTLKSLNKKPN